MALVAAPKPSELRDTGLSVLGRMPWSAHFTLFYETPADLLETIVPYFEAGLRAGELCVLLTSEPGTQQAAADKLRERVPGLDQRVARHDMEFIAARSWYRPDGRVDPDGVASRWLGLSERALREGYAGVRGASDMAWLGGDEPRGFLDVEEKVHAVMKNRPLMALCAYSLAKCTAEDILDLASEHHIAIARHRGLWQTLATPTLTQTKEQIERSNEELEQRIADRTRQLERSQAYLSEGERVSHSGSYAIDVASMEFRYVSDEGLRIFGFEPGHGIPSRAEFLERHAPDARARVHAALDAMLTDGRDTEDELRLLLPDGRTRYIYVVRHPVADANGRIVEIVGTALDITERKLAAARLARAKRAARERALEARFAAALEERTRLAREIHDSLLQGVTGIALQLRATLPRLRGASAATIAVIRQVVELAETTIRDARRAVWDMRSPSLVQKGLHTALEEAVRRAVQNEKLELAIDGRPRALAPEVEDTILRVAQEAVINAVKHAEARNIKVKLGYKPRTVNLTIADDGRGFTVEQGLHSYAGRWGLLGMRERADRIGATLKVRSVLRRGTSVQLRVPIAGTGKGGGR